jgi:hypothetical protein
MAAKREGREGILEVLSNVIALKDTALFSPNMLQFF